MAEQQPPVSYPLRGPPNAEARRHVQAVAMRGDYDMSNVDSLCKTLSVAIAVDDADLVIDASEVTFLGAATITVLIRARIFLSDYSRSLIVRSPSFCVRRIFEISGLDVLMETTDGRRAARERVAAGAVEAWDADPSTTPKGHPPRWPPDEDPFRVVASVGDDAQEKQPPTLTSVPAGRTERPGFSSTSVWP